MEWKFNGEKNTTALVEYVRDDLTCIVYECFVIIKQYVTGFCTSSIKNE